MSTALRRAVLAVSLLDADLADVELSDAGVSLGAAGSTLAVGWGELVLAAGGSDTPGDEVQRRVRRWLRLRRAVAEAVAVADSPESGADHLLARVRPLGLPVGHALHPGPAWTVRPVLGGALELGLALRGVDDDARRDPDACGVLPVSLLTAAGLDPAAALERAERYLEDMAGLAAERFVRDTSAVLRPLGDADVPTLLASARFRRMLLGGEGMRSAAIPTRRRGWLDLGRLDPAFVPAAAALTDPQEQGFPRPVLVTADEVTLVRPGGDIVAQSLADPAPVELGTPVERLA